MMPLRPTAWLNGLLGVTIFSGSLPATRVALRAFDPFVLTFGRATIAAIAGGTALLVLRQTWPRRDELPGLVMVAAGVVVGFPLLTAIALQHITASRGILFIAILPLMTALFAVMRAGEKPRPLFWLFSGAASLLVMGFALTTGAVAGSVTGDIAMFAAVILCGLGYAEGARLTQRLGGWQVICWALLLTLPVMLPLTTIYRPKSASGIDSASIAALLYVSLFSMLIGFIFWYRGLAQGGIARIGQLQFVQPFLGLLLAAAILGEPVGWTLLTVMALVIGCVFLAKLYA